MLGRHRLPMAPPPQREPCNYKLQPVDRPMPSVIPAAQTVFNTNSSEVSLKGLREISYSKDSPINADQLKITEKAAKTGKTAETERTGEQEPENLVQKENLTEPVMPADAPTSVENQSNGDHQSNLHQAMLGRHRLPMAPPPQRDPYNYKLQPVDRPMPPPSVIPAAQTVFNTNSSEVSLKGLREISYSKDSPINTDQLKITEKAAKTGKTAETERTGEQEHENLVQKENLAEPVKPADAPTSVENQSNGDYKSALEKVVHLSDMNKAKLFHDINMGGNVGKQNEVNKRTETGPEPTFTDRAPEILQIYKRLVEENWTQRIRHEVITTLIDMSESRAIPVDWSKYINYKTPSPAPASPWLRRVPPLKKMRFTDRKNHASQDHDDEPTMAPPARPRSVTCINPFESPVETSDRNYGNATQATTENQLVAARAAPSIAANIHIPGHMQHLHLYNRPTTSTAQQYGQQYGQQDAQQLTPQFQRDMNSNTYWRQYQLAQEQGAQMSGYPNTHWSNRPRKR